LSQPFSLSYRSILPTSLTYVILFRQRLLTLRTWCGYWYDMVWKWYFLILLSTTHHFSWNKSNTQLLEIINRFLKSTYYLSKGTLKNISFIKANKKYISEQIKLNTFSKQKKNTITNIFIFILSFYTEKITLYWIAFIVMMFIWVTSSYPDEI